MARSGHAIPALLVHPPAVPAHAQLARGVAHVKELVHVLGWGAPLALLALVGLFGPARREPVFGAFVAQGIVTIVGISASFAWLETIEPERYALVPFVVLVPAGLAVLRAGARALAKSHARAIEWAVGIALALFFGWTLTGWTYFVHVYGVGTPPGAIAYEVERNQIAGWIRQHSAADALIATDLLSDPVLTERSVVALPRGKQREPAGALDDFFAVWSPQLVLTTNGELARTLALGKAYRPTVRTAHLYMLERADSTGRSETR